MADLVAEISNCQHCVSTCVYDDCESESSEGKGLPDCHSCRAYAAKAFKLVPDPSADWSVATLGEARADALLAAYREFVVGLRTVSSRVLVAESRRPTFVVGSGNTASVFLKITDAGVERAIKRVAANNDGLRAGNAEAVALGEITKWVASEGLTSEAWRFPSIHGITRFGAHLDIEMDYVPGQNLTEAIEGPQGSGPLKGSDLRAFAANLCFSLHVIHRALVTHGDIKPDNILLLAGNPGRPVIVDFGSSEVHARKEERGAATGTPAYMAPEFFRDWKYKNPRHEKEDELASSVRPRPPSAGAGGARGRAHSAGDNRVDRAAGDCWALGLTIYYAAAGRLPWEFETWAGSHIVAHTRYPLKLGPLRSVGDDLVDELIGRLLDPDPESRLTAKGALKSRLMKEYCGASWQRGTALKELSEALANVLSLPKITKSPGPATNVLRDPNSPNVGSLRATPPSPGPLQPFPRVNGRGTLCGSVSISWDSATPILPLVTRGNENNDCAAITRRARAPTLPSITPIE